MGYMVRVELQGADRAEYTKLHKEMEKQGFKRSILRGGESLDLPDAEYWHEKEDLDHDVLRRALLAATTAHPHPLADCRVVVTRGTIVQTAGLKKTEVILPIPSP
jgi:hypothetical protein